MPAKRVFLTNMRMTVLSASSDLTNMCISVLSENYYLTIMHMMVFSEKSDLTNMRTLVLSVSLDLTIVRATVFSVSSDLTNMGNFYLFPLDYYVKAELGARQQLSDVP
jgi:hypothetical protein